MRIRPVKLAVTMAVLALFISFLLSTVQTAAVWAQEETHIMLEEMVPMRDGARLFTKIFLPDPDEWGDGPYPTIVSTTPYGVGAPGQLPLSWPDQPLNGYAFVYQDTRGRNNSEGIWSQGTDGIDGYDTVEWAAVQDWCNGKIGMSGGSALGLTTYRTAAERPPHLVAIQPTIASANAVADFNFEGGALQWETRMAWYAYVTIGLSDSHIESIGLTPEELAIAWMNTYIVLDELLSHTGFEEPYRPVDSEWWMHLPLDEVPGIEVLLTDWDEYFAHPSQDEYWEEAKKYDTIDVPGLHLGGWYDIFSKGTLSAFHHIQKRVGNQKLIMTDGVHRTVGILAPADYYYRWFDYWLKGEDTGIMDTPPISYYCMGAEEWRNTDQWPPPGREKVVYYLHGDGELSTHKPGKKEPSATYVYNPNDPVLTMGGRNLFIPAGSLDQRPVEPPNRNDVLVYASSVLKEDVEVSGNVEVVLRASSDALDTDFTAKLIDVHPDGSTMLILDGVKRARFRKSLKREDLLKPGKKYKFTIDLGDTSQVFVAGHRIQVDISSSNFPRRDRNTNTGNPLYVIDTHDDLVTATNTVYHDRHHLSYVVLPIMNGYAHVANEARDEAQEAIDQAMGEAEAAGCYAGNESKACSKALKEIEKAEKEMIKAQKEYEKGKYEKAADRHNKAQKHADKAMEKV